MRNSSKKRLGTGLLLAFIVMLGGSASVLGASAAFAAPTSGCDTNTYCTGARFVPTTSPYITRVYTYTCTGSSPVLVARAKVQITTTVAYGEKSLTAIGPNSYAELRANGTYTDSGWYCKAIG